MSRRTTSSSNAAGEISKTKEERDPEEDSDLVDVQNFKHSASLGWLALIILYKPYVKQTSSQTITDIEMAESIHFFDIFEEREMADPPDLTETDPRDESISISDGAREGKSMPLSLRNSSMRGPRSGRSYPRFLSGRRSTWETGWWSCFCRFRDRIPVELSEDCWDWFQSSSCSNWPA